MFQGGGRVAAAVAKAGAKAEAIDTARGPEHDIARPRAFKALARCTADCEFAAVMLAPPCTTFSRGRVGGGTSFPGPLRSTEHPWSLPAWNDSDTAKVEAATLVMQVVLHVLKRLMALDIPFVMESPQCSITWWLPELQQLMQRPGCKLISAHFCQWCTTKFFTFAVRNPEGLEGRFCARDCLCSRIGRLHLRLTGTNDQGVYWSQMPNPTHPF